AVHRGDQPADSFDDAVSAAAAMVTGVGDTWRWVFAVDVGAHYRPGTAESIPGLPAVPPLTPPYPARRGTSEGPLAQLKARTGVVPFVPRPEVENLIQWATRAGSLSSPTPTVRVAVIDGVGGAGKTRLAAQVADKLAETGWYTGFLDRNLP